MGPIDTGGVIGDGTVEFAPESHRGSTTTGLYEVQDGQLVVLEEAVNP